MVKGYLGVSLYQADGLTKSIELYQRQPKNRTLVFIDGDHSEEASYNDFWMYYPLVKKGGIFAGHDIVLESVKNSLKRFLGENFSKVITVSNNAWYMIKE